MNEIAKILEFIYWNLAFSRVSIFQTSIPQRTYGPDAKKVKYFASDAAEVIQVSEVFKASFGVQCYSELMGKLVNCI